MVIGLLHGMKGKCQLFFPFLPTGVLYGMKVKCNLMRQIYKRHLALRIFFSFMQEITLYFLRQNKLGFILT